MNIPCPIRVNCPPGFGQVPGDLEFDSPLANYSTEAPDVDLFIGFNTGWNLNLPRLGWTFGDPNWPGFCDSPISQAAADLCAASRQLQNTVQGGLTPENPWRKPNGDPVPLFPNAQQQCSFTCPDGLLFTWTVAAGQIQDLSQADADNIAKSIACQQARLHYLCLPALPNTCVGANYLETIQPTAGQGAAPPFTFDVVSGSLPPGLSLFPVGPVAAQIIGNPTAGGNYDFTLRVTDANGNFMQKAYSLSVLGITNIGSLPAGVENTAYSFQLNGAGGTAPYTFSLASGSLDGMTLSAAGLISGAPAYATANSYNFTVSITDSAGATCSANGTLKVNLRPGPDWTQLTWPFYGVVQNPPNFTAAGSASRNTGNGTLENKQIGFLSEISPAGSSIIKYTGPAVTCRCRVVITASSGNTQIALVATINGVGGNITNLANKPPGTYDFDFNSGALVNGSLNIEGGINDVDPSNNILAFLGGIGSLAFSFVIFNV